jgi:hypothetical protein
VKFHSTEKADSHLKEEKREFQTSHFLDAKSHCCQKFEFLGLEFNDFFHSLIWMIATTATSQKLVNLHFSQPEKYDFNTYKG